VRPSSEFAENLTPSILPVSAFVGQYRTLESVQVQNTTTAAINISAAKKSCGISFTILVNSFPPPSTALVDNSV
jgi:hypothetical protein